ncbi:MAG: PepSY domain-containing protein [Idiomarina sp.]|nr:PepSY domain-containing protein [Idiomarina sp.]
MRFKPLKARKIHRWLTLLFGIQLIIWSITGAAMVILQLPYIHGDHLVQPADRSVSEFTYLENITSVANEYPDATEVTLVNRYINNGFQHVFVVNGNATRLLDAATLQPLTITEQDIRALAKRYYAPRNAPSNAPSNAQANNHEPNIAQLQLLTEPTESELAARHLPAWQVRFADTSNTTLYLSAVTGSLVTQRHTAWRFFDFMWMLHIMDYQDRSDITKPWLLAFTVLTLLISISGLMLLVQKYLSRPWRRLWRDSE